MTEIKSLPKSYQPSQTELGRKAGYEGPFDNDLPKHDSSSHVSTSLAGSIGDEEDKFLEMAARDRIVSQAAYGRTSLPSNLELRRQAIHKSLDVDVSDMSNSVIGKSEWADLPPDPQIEDVKNAAGLNMLPAQGSKGALEKAWTDIKEGGHDKPGFGHGIIRFDQEGVNNQRRKENLSSLQAYKEKAAVELKGKIGTIKEVVDLMFNPNNEDILMEAMEIAKDESLIIQRIALGLAAADSVADNDNKRFDSKDEIIQKFVELHNKGKLDIENRHYERAATIFKSMLAMFASKYTSGDQDTSAYTDPMRQVARGYKAPKQ